MYRVTVARLAQRQLDHALAWYADRAPEQIGRLLNSAESASKAITKSPFLSREVVPGMRRVALRRFPYHLWYVVDGEEIVIVAMTHFRQDTSYLAVE
ncbi:MAG: type II toxin-antitoxin system RelE/ParE family toxin [Propionibacteriaceae bacterium]|jgi:plasmid stabilization system protein ParE|nr:type II toxin-antitoxin system RelE/ParE family toxin [Propionibacteriaceae bacterium]